MIRLNNITIVLTPIILAVAAFAGISSGFPESGGTKVVMLDCYHNNEWKATKGGGEVRYHYIWEDTANSGYSELGEVIKRLGAEISESRVPPSDSVLRDASIYIVVDPDDSQETKDPHYITDSEIESLVAWVRDGGVLAIFANDSGNCEFNHLNRLSGCFGIRFNQNSRNDVVGKDFETGAFAGLPNVPMFEGVKKIYLKEISTLRIENPAVSDLTDHGDIIMASAGYGKGFVFAVGDPWLYNEYIDNRKLPAGFDNNDAAKSLFRWLLSKAHPVDKKSSGRN
jgi:unsaturated rhamnogalacturonyl hydrolase